MLKKSRRRWADSLAAASCWAAALLVAVAFAWILGDIVGRGISGLSWEFLTGSPRQAGREGGIAPILVSTVGILGVCLAAAVPVGVATAVLLAEFSRGGSAFGLLVRRSLDVLAGVPSIVFGLFGNTFFSHLLGLGFSILSGGLTLACMVLPLLIRTVEEGFRSIPDEYRQGAAALGLSKTGTLRHLLLPAALPALAVGLVLGMGRALAETAALLYTSGYVDRFPASLLDSGRALSIHIFDLAMNVPGGTERAYTSALVLIILLLAVNAVSMGLTRWWMQRKAVSG